jgi:hypothetical protein
MSPEWLRGSSDKPTDERLNPGMTVSYEVAGYASIHYHPKDNLRDKEKLALFEEGLTELARRLQGRTDIQYVAATSWIVAVNSKFFTRRRLFKLASPEGNPDIQALVGDYKWRRDHTKIVPRKYRNTEPQVALLEIKDLVGRLKRREVDS